MPETRPPLILVIEDDRNIAKALKYNLAREGYRVEVAHDGEAGLERFREEPPQLVVLDLMIPKLNGFEFCKAVRARSQAPILILSAKADEMDRVLGLELGADDYVPKPFSMRELLARVRNLLRRASGAAKASWVRAGELEVDLDRYEVRVGGRPAKLSPKEFEFLRCLLEADGRALTRQQLLERVWGYDRSMEVSTNTVEQHVARLRDKLGSEASRVVTVKNVGYRLKRD